MINLTSELAAIEKLMQLMETYRVDEISCDYICIKKSRFAPTEPTDKELLDQHTNSKTLAEIKAIAETRIADVEAWMEKGD